MPSSSQTSQSSLDLSADPIRWRVLAILLTTIFMSLVNVSIVNVALPSIQHSLHASQSDLQWVLSGYALTFGVVLVAAGRAGDILGRGGLFMLGLVIFIAAALVAGMAPNANWLNGARLMQGLGSGLISPQGLGMIQQYFRGAERGRAFGYFGSVVGISVAVGPLLGGLLIQFGGEEWGWRLSFLVNVPFALAALILAWLWFPRPLVDFTAPTAKNKWGRIREVFSSLDPIGSILLGLAVLFVLLPFMEARSNPSLWLLLLLGLLLVYLWIKWEVYYQRSGRQPMVDLGIFATPSFANGSLIMTLYFLGMTSIWVIVAIYMQEGVGRSALEAGLVGIPASLLSSFSASWAGKRVATLGRKIVIWGIILAILGMLLSIGVVYLQNQGLISIWWLLASLSLVGIAQGAVISPNQTLTLEDVPLHYAGSSGAIMQTGQRIGTSVGIAVITAVLFGALQHTSWSTAVSLGFAVISLVLLVSLVFAIKDHLRRNIA